MVEDQYPPPSPEKWYCPCPVSVKIILLCADIVTFSLLKHGIGESCAELEATDKADEYE